MKKTLTLFFIFLFSFLITFSQKHSAAPLRHPQAAKAELINKAGQKEIARLTAKYEIEKRAALAEAASAKKRYAEAIAYLKKHHATRAISLLAKKEEADRIAATGGKVDKRKQAVESVERRLNELLKELKKLK